MKAHQKVNHSLQLEVLERCKNQNFRSNKKTNFLAVLILSHGAEQKFGDLRIRIQKTQPNTKIL